MHDNAGFHKTNATKKFPDSFEWDILEQPPHCSNLAPSNYHLVSSLKVHMRIKREMEKWPPCLIASIDRDGEKYICKLYCRDFSFGRLLLCSSFKILLSLANLLLLLPPSFGSAILNFNSWLFY